jgi:hypothetical protein
MDTRISRARIRDTEKSAKAKKDLSGASVTIEANAKKIATATYTRSFAERVIFCLERMPSSKIKKADIMKSAYLFKTSKPVNGMLVEIKKEKMNEARFTRDELGKTGKMLNRHFRAGYLSHKPWVAQSYKDQDAAAWAYFLRSQVFIIQRNCAHRFSTYAESMRT